MSVSHTSPSPSPHTATSLSAPTFYQSSIETLTTHLTLPSSDAQNGESDVTTHPQLEIDPQILEALRSKDRLYVLKLGELMEGLINERR